MNTLELSSCLFIFEVGISLNTFFVPLSRPYYINIPLHIRSEILYTLLTSIQHQQKTCKGVNLLSRQALLFSEIQMPICILLLQQLCIDGLCVLKVIAMGDFFVCMCDRNLVLIYSVNFIGTLNYIFNLFKHFTFIIIV